MGPSLEIVIDAETVRRLQDRISRAANAESFALARRLGDTAVRFLRTMDEGAGHDRMAKLWTHTTPVERADGTVRVEVYSKAEGMTFYARSGKTGQKRGHFGQQWPFKGEQLVRWLEYGVDPHAFGPSHPQVSALEFKTTGFTDDDTGAFMPTQSSDFLGTARTARGGEVGRFVNDQDEQGLVAFAEVNHPGFAGNRFLHLTKLLIEARLRADADLAARNIEARI